MFSLSWLVLSWGLTFGYQPQMYQNIVCNLENKYCELDYANSFYEDISISALALNHLHIYGNVKTYDYPEAINKWKPYRADYGIGAEFVYKSLRIGIHHECDHTVLHEFYMRDQEQGYGADITKIYVKIGGTF